MIEKIRTLRGKPKKIAEMLEDLPGIGTKSPGKGFFREKGMCNLGRQLILLPGTSLVERGVSSS